MLKIRGRPVQPFLSDGSAVVTAVLLALAIPPLAPWWMTLIGVAFAIVIAKHLYGGLGHNTFNPAMVGYVVLLISFPKYMTSWQAPLTLASHPLSFMEALRFIFGGGLPGSVNIDAVTTATVLDTLKTQLRLAHPVNEISATHPIFGTLAGVGTEWIALGFLAGGLWLIYKKVIAWHIPAAVLGSLAIISTIAYLSDSAHYAGPLFHLVAGASILGAFFIATDPVTAPAATRGRVIYGIGIGVLIYIIRAWGGYPDAVAFAVLLMNLATPTIDYYIKPRTFGHVK